MRILFTIALFLLIKSGLAQNAILNDPVSARVFNTEKYSGIKGSSFLEDEWVKGKAYTSKGYYDNIELKLDVYNNTLMFNKNNQPFEFEEDIISFIFMPSADSTSYKYFKKGITASGLKPAQYVQVLVDGPVQLIRSDAKQVADVNEINQGVIKTFTSNVRYYTGKNSSFELIKLNQKDVLASFSDKEAELKEYAKKNKLNFRNEKDVVELVRFYNNK